jgi:hypothetical protein
MVAMAMYTTARNIRSVKKKLKRGAAWSQCPEYAIVSAPQTTTIEKKEKQQ